MQRKTGEAVMTWPAGFRLRIGGTNMLGTHQLWTWTYVGGYFGGLEQQAKGLTMGAKAPRVPSFNHFR
jgi:hypothetical protein